MIIYPRELKEHFGSKWATQNQEELKTINLTIGDKIKNFDLNNYIYELLN